MFMIWFCIHLKRVHHIFDLIFLYLSFAISFHLLFQFCHLITFIYLIFSSVQKWVYTQTHRSIWHHFENIHLSFQTEPDRFLLCFNCYLFSWLFVYVWHCNTRAHCSHVHVILRRWSWFSVANFIRKICNMTRNDAYQIIIIIIIQTINVWSNSKKTQSKIQVFKTHNLSAQNSIKIAIFRKANHEKE